MTAKRRQFKTSDSVGKINNFRANQDPDFRKYSS